MTYIKDGGEPSGTAPVDAYSDYNDPVPPNSCKGFYFFSGVNVQQGNVEIKN